MNRSLKIRELHSTNILLKLTLGIRWLSTIAPSPQTQLKLRAHNISLKIIFLPSIKHLKIKIIKMLPTYHQIKHTSTPFYLNHQTSLTSNPVKIKLQLKCSTKPLQLWSNFHISTSPQHFLMEEMIGCHIQIWGTHSSKNSFLYQDRAQRGLFLRKVSEAIKTSLLTIHRLHLTLK